MLQLSRNGLILQSLTSLDESQGSSNVKVNIQNDGTYTNYSTQLHYGYYVHGFSYTKGIARYENGVFILPREAFEQYGLLNLSVLLVSSDEELMTNQVQFIVQAAPRGDMIIDDIPSAQQQVLQLVQTTLDQYANTINLNKNEIAVLKTRMDSFTSLQQGSTTGDAELIDGRVGFDGKTYENIGDAIRGQVSQLSDENILQQEQIDRLNEGGLNLKDEVIGNNVNQWLDEHPEATTTVQDGSIEEIKFTDTLRKRKASFYNSVADMKADNSLKEGMTAITLGYHEIDDGGGAMYLIEGSIKTSTIQENIENGKFASLIVNGDFNLLWTGKTSIHDMIKVFKNIYAEDNNKLGNIYLPSSSIFSNNPASINVDGVQYWRTENTIIFDNKLNYINFRCDNIIATNEMTSVIVVGDEREGAKYKPEDITIDVKLIMGQNLATYGLWVKEGARISIPNYLVINACTIGLRQGDLNTTRPCELMVNKLGTGYCEIGYQIKGANGVAQSFNFNILEIQEPLINDATGIELVGTFMMMKIGQLNIFNSANRFSNIIKVRSKDSNGEYNRQSSLLIDNLYILPIQRNFYIDTIRCNINVVNVDTQIQKLNIITTNATVKMFINQILTQGISFTKENGYLFVDSQYPLVIDNYDGSVAVNGIFGNIPSIDNSFYLNPSKTALYIRAANKNYKITDLV